MIDETNRDTRLRVKMFRKLQPWANIRTNSPLHDGLGYDSTLFELRQSLYDNPQNANAYLVFADCLDEFGLSEHAAKVRVCACVLCPGLFDDTIASRWLEAFPIERCAVHTPVLVDTGLYLPGTGVANWNQTMLYQRTKYVRLSEKSVCASNTQLQSHYQFAHVSGNQIRLSWTNAGGSMSFMLPIATTEYVYMLDAADTYATLIHYSPVFGLAFMPYMFYGFSEDEQDAYKIALKNLRNLSKVHKDVRK